MCWSISPLTRANVVLNASSADFNPSVASVASSLALTKYSIAAVSATIAAPTPVAINAPFIATFNPLKAVDAAMA